MVRILVVDDELDVEALIMQKFRNKVRRKEWEFTFSRNGEEALEVLRKDHSVIDIVLSDINMPKMDGLALLQKIGEEGFDLRTIVVSAYSDIENIRTAMNNGAFDFITKPINFQDMEHTIQRSFASLNEMRDALRSRDDLLVLKKELNLAHKIQQSILPREFDVGERIDIHAFMTPAKEIGGDFYDFFNLSGDKIAALVADVSGKGVPAALFAMANQALIRGIASGLNESTAELLKKINITCCKNNENCMFITLFLAIIDKKTGELTYTNAGHTPPVLLTKGGSLDFLPLTDDVPLGISELEDFSEKTIQLQPGDAIFVYTDGVTEAMNRDAEEVGTDRLLAELGKKQDACLIDIDEHVYNEVQKFADGTRQFDDLTYLSLRYLGS
ncbi:MAG: SpoIIE family protein phosphatase [Pseudomonadota bacterium]|nr:SpoIIE family protein phosphatase [Pseudomonadota bacterium]